MRVSPADAAYLMIWVSVSAVLGRIFITALIEPLGRRGAATLCMVCGGVGMIGQGYLYDVYIGGWSLFYVLFIVQTFFGSTNYSVVGACLRNFFCFTSPTPFAHFSLQPAPSGACLRCVLMSGAIPYRRRLRQRRFPHLKLRIGIRRAIDQRNFV
jgi:hypothetical protein